MKRNPVRIDAKMNPTLVKDMMESKFPILPAKYPNKPSPIHISNNFIALALGEGPLKLNLREWIHGVANFDDLDSSIKDKHELAQDRFRELLRTIFDTDGNVYKSMGSPFPISNRFLGKDPSDDGYATGLWKSIGDSNRKKIHDLLSEFYFHEDNGSALDNLILKLTDTSDFNRNIPQIEVFSSTVGSNIAEILLSGLSGKRNLPIHIKLEVVRQFSTLLAGFVAIGMLFDACAEDRNLDSQAIPSDVLGTFVYTGNIGSRTTVEQKLGSLAVLSLQDTFDRAYSGINKQFIIMVNNIIEETGVKDWDKFCKRFATEYLSGKNAQELIKILQQYNDQNIESLLSDLFPLSHLVKSVKYIGTKSGLVWPSRRSSPRLVLDTNFLTSLVSFIGHQDMSVGEFVAEVNLKLGLIMGYTGVTEGEILHLEHIAGRKLEVRDLLVKAEKMLTLRLVSAGLARQYSDGSAALVGGVI